MVSVILLAAALSAAAPRDSVIVEADSTALHLLGVETMEVEAHRMALAARGSRAWMIYHEAGAESHAETGAGYTVPVTRLVNPAASLVDSLSSGVAPRDSLSQTKEVEEVIRMPGLRRGAVTGIAPAGPYTSMSPGLPSGVTEETAPGDSLTLSIAYQEPRSPYAPTMFLMPLDAALDTLLRVAGAEALRYLPVDHIAVEALRDSVRVLTVPWADSVMAFGIGWRMTDSTMGEWTARPLPQLTDGWRFASGQVPLTWRGVCAPGDTVTVRFEPFTWKQPCTQEPCE